MESRALVKDVMEINRRLFYDLWNISAVPEAPTGLSPRLILPTRRSEDIRISEQEARFLYCSLLNNLNYFYSVETPTERRFIQKGKIPRSASSDLSLYDYDGKKFLKLMNVEFKAHTPREQDIKKDIEKLIAEKKDGNWFHLLKNIQSGTLRRNFEKISNSLKSCQRMLKVKKVSIVFSFCVLERKWACSKHFLYEPSVGSFSEYADRFFFNLKLDVKRRSIKVVDDAGWQIIC
ncbi:MAG: hypothetical protein SWQ30_15940 [Thermodesulfobacteriota bacterium]|nr:hypothetical protein [Thermodesulfobacteriota bacterium]